MIEIFKSPGKAHEADLLTPVHEIGHLVGLLQVGIIPMWVSCMPSDGVRGMVAGEWHLFLDCGQDFAQIWKYQITMLYAGIVASSYYSGIYLYDNAKGDFQQVEEYKQIYGLSDEDLTGCWLDAHASVKNRWPLILALAMELKEKELLGAEDILQWLIREGIEAADKGDV